MSNSHSSTDTDRDRRTERIRQIVKDCLLARASGEVITDASLLQTHPDLMPELTEELHNLRMIEQAEQMADQTEISGLHIRCPHCQNPVELVEEKSQANHHWNLQENQTMASSHQRRGGADAPAMARDKARSLSDKCRQETCRLVRRFLLDRATRHGPNDRSFEGAVFARIQRSAT